MACHQRADPRLPDGATETSAYDAAGNRIRHTDFNGATVTYAHDAEGRLGRLTTVTDPRGGVYDHGYDAAGRRTSLSYPNGVETSYAHDAAGRLLTLHTEAPDGTVIQDYAYALGPTGQRQSVTEHDGTVRSWEYDALYRLTRERVTDGEGALVYENAFAYDPVGNRTEQTRTGADGSSERIVYVYDARDRLLSESVAEGPVTSYGWDSNGNLVSKVEVEEETTRYGWDFENRLLSAELPDGTVVGYGYDAAGIRTSVTVSAGPDTTSVQYVVDTSRALSRVVAEIAESEGLMAMFPRGVNLLGVLRAGQDLYTHGDHVESIRALTESSGGTSSIFNYEAFGQLLSPPSDDTIPILFAGEHRDPATGLYYLRARWMSSSTGRFVSLDPFPGSTLDPRTLQGYGYSLQDPVNRKDPSGLFAVANVVTLGAFAIAAIALSDISYRGITNEARRLTPGERLLAQSVFGVGEIDLDRVRVFRGRFAAFQGRDFMAPDGNIYVAPTVSGQDYSDFSVATSANRVTFVHELVHVWQVQKGKWVWIEGMGSVFHGYYCYQLDENSSWDQLNVEQQASIVEDYHEFGTRQPYAMLVCNMRIDADSIRLLERVIPFSPSNR